MITATRPGLAALLLVACTASAAEHESPGPGRKDPPRARPVVLSPSDKKLDVSQHSFFDVSFRVGQRVRLKSESGVLEPPESGHSAPIVYGPGQMGTVVGFISRPYRVLGATGDSSNLSSGDFDVSLVIVRWDAQRWRTWIAAAEQEEPGAGPAVHVSAFEATVEFTALAIARR